MKWEVTYVTSSHNYDQVLASTLVGPISVGTSRFALRADPPKLEDLSFDEIIYAALLVTVFYNDQEFYRIGYMLAHEFPPNMTEENIDYKQLIRHISTDKDDITTKTSQIKWT